MNSITAIGGIERIVTEKMNYLTALKDYDITLVYFGTDSTIPFYPLNERIKRRGIISNYAGNSILMRIWRIIKIRKRVKSIINEAQPDIIVNASMALVSWMLPFMSRNVSKIIELHSSRIGKKILDREIFGNRRFVNCILDFIRGRFYAYYDRCVMLTEDGLREYNLKNAIVIPNFTNLQFSDVNVSRKGKIAVNVGRLSFQKNQELLINAWKIVHDQEPEWQMEIWGNGELKDDLTKQIYSLELDDVVSLKGVTDHIEKVYSYASFFVLSSRHEGQGIVLIEALLSGIPCVSTVVNGVRDTIINDYNGYIVEQATPKALANGILKMIHSDRMDEMSRNAKESAKAFEKEHVMQMWINLFNELIHENRH